MPGPPVPGRGVAPYLRSGSSSSPGRWSTSTSRTWQTRASATTCRAACLAASAAASLSRSRSSPGLPWCCSTSRPPDWTRTERSRRWPHRLRWPHAHKTHDVSPPLRLPRLLNAVGSMPWVCFPSSGRGSAGGVDHTTRGGEVLPLCMLGGRGATPLRGPRPHPRLYHPPAARRDLRALPPAAPDQGGRNHVLRAGGAGAYGPARYRPEI